MSHYAHGQSGAAFAWRRPIPWRAFFDGAVDILRTWARRRRQRHELLDYMAIDHRTASDIGLSENDARQWAARPFWQP